MKVRVDPELFLAFPDEFILLSFNIKSQGFTAHWSHIQQKD